MGGPKGSTTSATMRGSGSIAQCFCSFSFACQTAAWTQPSPALCAAAQRRIDDIQEFQARALVKIRAAADQLADLAPSGWLPMCVRAEQGRQGDRPLSARQRRRRRVPSWRRSGVSTCRSTAVAGVVLAAWWAGAPARRRHAILEASAERAAELTWNVRARQQDQLHGMRRLKSLMI